MRYTMRYKGRNKFGNWYNAHLERYLPRYAFFSLIGCFAWNCMIYWFTMYVGADFYHHDLTMAIDRSIPFCPAWASVYVLSYPFWILSYWLTARGTGRAFWFRFVTADMLARVVCGVIYLLFPTTNLRPDILGDGIWDWVMGWIYAMDQPTNLFPSIHCLASLMSYLGVRKAEGLSKGYKAATLIFAMLIFLSTQFTKQHYMADVAGGIGVALICYGIAMRTQLYKVLMRGFEKLDCKAFGVDDEIDKKEKSLDK